MHGCEDKRTDIYFGIDCFHAYLDEIDEAMTEGESCLPYAADLMTRAKMLACNMGQQAATNDIMKMEESDSTDDEWKEAFLKTLVECETKQERGLVGDFVYGVYGLYFTSYILSNRHGAVPTNDEIEAYRKKHINKDEVD